MQSAAYRFYFHRRELVRFFIQRGEYPEQGHADEIRDGDVKVINCGGVFFLKMLKHWTLLLRVLVGLVK